MKVGDVVVLKEVADDLNDGKIFYDQREVGVGDYFWDSLLADLESLIIYAGIHNKECGLYRMLAKRFPYAIYYKLEEESVVVVWRVLDLRRDPKKIRQSLRTGRTSRYT